MKQPILVVMAAGMGSRYGGLKQLDQLGPNGETIIDFSVQDALSAGFKRVIFIIKETFSNEFRKIVGHKYESLMEVYYVYQALEDIPNSFAIPEGRIKPWGTAHAIWCAREWIDAPFAVINADDFYGLHAYQVMYHYLISLQDDNHYAMVGYQLSQTISPNGTVSRGLCTVNDNGELLEIEEQTQIEAYDQGIHYTEDGVNWIDVDKNTIVSMNLWGFPQDFIRVIDENLLPFLKHTLKSNPLKGEYFLPSVVKKQIEKAQAVVKVLPTDAQWFGVTYSEDKAYVQEQLQKIVMKRKEMVNNG